MEMYVGIGTLLFFYASVGAAWISEGQMFSSRRERVGAGMNVVLAMLFSCITFCMLSGWPWYWSVLVNLICMIPAGLLLVSIYIFFAGVFSRRTKRRISIYKSSLSFDGTVLLSVGVFLFILYCFL